MGRQPKQGSSGNGASARARKVPAPADYSDELSDADLKAVEAVVKERAKKEDEEWELVDGPAW